MGGDVSKMAKQELVATIRDRYRQSSKKDKGRILDEFTAITGHHRKHSIRLLSGAAQPRGLHGAAWTSQSRSCREGTSPLSQRRVKDWRGVMAKGLVYSASDEPVSERSEKVESVLVGVWDIG